MPEKTILRVVTVLQRLKLGGCPTRRYLRVRSPRQPVRGLTTVGRRPTRDQRRSGTRAPRVVAGRDGSRFARRARGGGGGGGGGVVVVWVAGMGVERLPAL